MSNNIGKTLSIIQSLEENEQYEKAVEELLKLNEAVPDNIEIVKNLAMDYEVLKNADPKTQRKAALKLLLALEEKSFDSTND